MCRQRLSPCTQQQHAGVLALCRVQERLLLHMQHNCVPLAYILLVLHVLLLLVPCSTGKVSPHGSLMPPGALQADLWQPGAVIGSSANAKVNMPVLGWRS